MTLGGLALAVGILVDESTVAVENIHVQLTRTGSVALAVWRGISETAVPRLLAMLCILAVFIPSFLMQGAAKALFVPLALAVGFAMIASYILSSTFVPILSIWLLKGRNGREMKAEFGERSFSAYFIRPASILLALRWIVVPVYLIAAAAALVLTSGTLGTEIFPRVDAGQFQFRLKAPDRHSHRGDRGDHAGSLALHRRRDPLRGR